MMTLLFEMDTTPGIRAITAAFIGDVDERSPLFFRNDQDGLERLEIFTQNLIAVQKSIARDMPEPINVNGNAYIGFTTAELPVLISLMHTIRERFDESNS